MFATLAHFGVRSMPPSGLANNVTTIGPLIASLLAVRPSDLKQCAPCLGPRNERWRFKSTLFPMTMESAPQCICNGGGLCIYPLDDPQPRLTVRCTCIRECFDQPAAVFKEQAWKVIYVMKLVKLAFR